MSHHSDDNMLIATSDSFWEPGNYKKTTKRIEDGYKLCQELTALINERAEIEKNYAKSLKSWSKKWNDAIEKGPEYGTTEAAWKGVLVEADRRCDLHSKIRDNLVNDVLNKIKQWQKDTYHRMISPTNKGICDSVQSYICSFLQNAMLILLNIYL
ncbi:unnamed protein product [Acanthoscelides obtectus]|uniref:F-BAR domain-containing protein n=1 Tax=Acanthoscelides obtectus TaxID=200917 RepID=A0A9P0PGU7_ACAOB|nr:unnamed protein product [Acanthoscelides obtectus]CAK1666240.1 Protein kinase C and casein kinase substrate in neurons protein 1 [Acanthoscelides obtectus]